MIPTLVLVGHPNVGKSTLFNRITRSNRALVAALPGLTRDRHYGRARIGDKPILVVDTGGFEPDANSGIVHEMAKQTAQAIAEADVVLFLVDARAGLTHQDRLIAQRLRQGTAPVWLAVNKAEGMDAALAAAEFHELGLGQPYAISAAHGEQTQELFDLIAQGVADEPDTLDSESVPKIAIVGRPNVGKSTLVNSMVGEYRVIAYAQPGTTRDSIYIPLERGDKRYILIDTAGLRRRGKVFEAVEKFSVIKTLQSIEDANVVVLVLDALHDITEQDARVAGFILETGRALVVAVNKNDQLNAATRMALEREISRKLPFLSFASMHYISALRGSGLTSLFRSIDGAYAAAMVKLSTPRLTRALAAATAQHPPPQSGRHRPRLRFAHQGGVNPPRVVVHGNATQGIPESYRRYLENALRSAFKLRGTPLRVEFKAGENPFAGRKPEPLAPSIVAQRRRQRRYSKRRYA